ncbi:MAG: MSMEG_0568 family radical SAM protein [Pseudomonadota bacterium]
MREVITGLQSLGVRVPETITGRNGGAGPAEGSAFIIGNSPVNIPIAGGYVKHSPFALEWNDHHYLLTREGTACLPVAVVPEPAVYRLKDPAGIPYRQIALLHGKDCLATTVLQRCVNWKNQRRCAFCATEVSLERGSTLARKTPAQLAEVARLAVKLDGVRHMVLTSGTGDPSGSEIAYLAHCVAAIKTAIDLPIHVQFLPPADLSLMDRLKQAGTDTVGIHIESFHGPTLEQMAPAKSEIGLAHYEKAWQRAVALFGPNQVSSFLIAGLGEPPESLVDGSEVLADLGVFPFVVPLRPIPGSRLENRLPPDAALMGRIYEAVAGILHRKGLASQKSLAGCVRCGACSALSFYEKPAADFTCHSARSERELSEAFAIRHRVFVDEQGIFTGTDRDEQDTISIHLIARQGEKMVGTVRVFPDPGNDNGHWIGGRLAVHPDYRVFRIGASLVKEAMKRVKKKGCTVFTAHVQEKNVRFFQKLGWTPIGSMETIRGRPHRHMRADLDRVPEEFQCEL